MLDTIVQLYYLLRPVLLIDINTKLLGIDLFDFFNIGLTSILGLVWLGHILKSRSLSLVDLFILSFCIWCIFISFLNIEHTTLRQSTKYVLGPITYVFMKPFMRNIYIYIKCVKLFSLSYSIPIVISFFLILNGKTLYYDNFLNNYDRYAGIFINPHNLAHSMLIFIFIFFITIHLNNIHTLYLNCFYKKLYIYIIILLSIYSLYFSVVRTAWFGLIIFLTLYIFYINKKMFILFITTLIVLIYAFTPVFISIAPQTIDSLQGNTDTTQMASGRPSIWMHNIEQFREFPLHNKLAGIGLGASAKNKNIWDSHNDFLDVLIQTGIIGMLLLLIFNVMIFVKIVSMSSSVKYVFLSMFISVLIMNVVSNSYISRFNISQMFFMLLTFIEIQNDHDLSKQ